MEEVMVAVMVVEAMVAVREVEEREAEMVGVVKAAGAKAVAARVAEVKAEHRHVGRNPHNRFHRGSNPLPTRRLHQHSGRRS